MFTKQVVIFYYAAGVDHAAKKKAYNIIGYMYNKPDLSRYLDKLKHPLLGQPPGGLHSLHTHETQANAGGNTARATKPEKEAGVLETINFENSESSKMSQLMQLVMNGAEVKHLVEKEFEELVLWITNIELRIKEIVKTNPQYSEESFENLTFASIVSALLQMLDKQELSKQLHLIGLQVVRKLVEVENRDLVTPAADWDSEDYIEFKGNIVAKQDAMVDIGAVQFLCKHIAEVEDDALLEQCLLIGISLLIGGNNKAQEAFYVYFRDSDEYNRVLMKLKQMLMKEFDQAKAYLQEKNAKLTMIAKAHDRMNQIKIMRLQKNAAADEKAKNMAEGLPPAGAGEKGDAGFDNPDVSPFQGTGQEDEDEEPFDETLEQLMTLDNTQNNGASMVTENGAEAGGEHKKPSDDSAKQASVDQGHSIRKVIRILRFLQLLVEGHYRPLQDHMREQRMFDGTPNPKSFDFVASISTYLGIFEKQYVNCYSCEMGYQMIDTLIELIQGPCKENQATLVSSKVIDNCRDLISQGTSERELRQKGFVGEKLGLLNGLK